MCIMSMKLPVMIGQNPPQLLIKKVEKTDNNKKMLSMLDLDHKCQGHSRNQKTMTGNKKNLSRESLSNWCDADANADMDTNKGIGKIICRSPPFGGGGGDIPYFRFS